MTSYVTYQFLVDSSFIDNFIIRYVGCITSKKEKKSSRTVEDWIISQRHTGYCNFHSFNESKFYTTI